MHGPRQLLAYLLRLSALCLAFSLVIVRFQHMLLQEYRSLLLEFHPVIADIEQVLAETMLLHEQAAQLVFHAGLPVVNEATMVMTTATDLATFTAAYWLYLWTEPVIQMVQLAAQFPSIETIAEVEVPGGVTVWVVVVFALVTYAFVYHQYPTHEDWVSTVLSIVLPFLSRWLWKSD